MKKSVMFMTPLLLSACAASQAGTETASVPAGGTCKNDALSQFVGQTVSPELGAAMLKASGARTLRWAPPRSALTMDFREDRLTVSYGDDQKVTTLSCG